MDRQCHFGAFLVTIFSRTTANKYDGLYVHVSRALNLSACCTVSSSHARQRRSISEGRKRARSTSRNSFEGTNNSSNKGDLEMDPGSIVVSSVAGSEGLRSYRPVYLIT